MWQFFGKATYPPQLPGLPPARVTTSGSEVKGKEQWSIASPTGAGKSKPTVATIPAQDLKCCLKCRAHPQLQLAGRRDDVAGLAEGRRTDHPVVRLRIEVRGVDRSEERRVGKECRSRWSPHH